MFRFINICVGAVGSRSDGGVLNESYIGRDIITGKSDDWLPEDDYLDEDPKVKVTIVYFRKFSHAPIGNGWVV